MAEGNITRIVGGKNIIETEEWVVYTDKFTAYAGKGSHFTAEGGTKLGNPKSAPSVGHYFKNAWWSSDREGNKKITKAKVGDTVYFQVEMTNEFPNTKLQADKQRKVNFNLFKFDGNYYSVENIFILPGGLPIYAEVDKKPKKNKNQEIHYISWVDTDKDGKISEDERASVKPYTEVIAEGNKAVISFRIEHSLSSYFNEFDELKLFMSLSYNNEILELPEKETDFLDIEPLPPVIKEIYVRLLNYQVSQEGINSLNKMGGTIQNIRGNDNYMSEKVNMDYFSVRIDELPTFANGNIMLLYKKIRENFLILSKGSVPFTSHSANQMEINGKWEFKPYPKEDSPNFPKEQLVKWKNESGNVIFLIEAGGGFKENIVGDDGAVLESECKPNEMCWIFTTIYTEKSDTQPFSGHRQFGIHKDEEGNYRFFARAIDRVWPSKLVRFGSENKDRAVKDYLTIADATWKNLINNVCLFINNNGGKSYVMPPYTVRTKFAEFNSKYTTAPTLHIGNIPQYKEITEDEI